MGLHLQRGSTHPSLIHYLWHVCYKLKRVILTFNNLDIFRRFLRKAEATLFLFTMIKVTF